MEENSRGIRSQESLPIIFLEHSPIDILQVFFAEVNLESLPQKTPIDHKNTLYQDPYSLVGARLGYKKGQWTFFVQGNNLTDKVYASSYLVQAESYRTSYAP